MEKHNKNQETFIELATNPIIFQIYNSLFRIIIKQWKQYLKEEGEKEKADNFSLNLLFSSLSLKHFYSVNLM